jgi:hypothetical protein
MTIFWGVAGMLTPSTFVLTAADIDFGIRFERLHDNGRRGYRQRALLRQWRSFLALLSRRLQSGEEYGIADAMNLTRLDCPHAYSYQRVAVTFAYDKSRSIRTTIADGELLGTAILVSYVTDD